MMQMVGLMRGGYQLRLNNVKSLLSDLNLTYKMRDYDKVMILGFDYFNLDLILQE